jgi:hypothetical protein
VKYRSPFNFKIFDFELNIRSSTSGIFEIPSYMFNQSHLATFEFSNILPYPETPFSLLVEVMELPSVESVYPVEFMQDLSTGNTVTVIGLNFTNQSFCLIN